MWMDEAAIRAAFDLLERDIPTGKMTFAINSALSEIAGWISSEDYDLVTADSAGTDPKVLKLAQAQGWLTKAYLCDMGIRLRKEGGLKQAQDAGSPATAQTITNQYLTPKDLAEEAAKSRNNAETLAKPYLVSEVVEDSAPPRSTSKRICFQW